MSVICLDAPPRFETRLVRIVPSDGTRTVASMSANVSEGHPGTFEPLMSIDDVAQVLAISARGVYRLMNRGDLVTVKVGSCTRVEPQELRRYIAQRRRPAEKEIDS